MLKGDKRNTGMFDRVRRDRERLPGQVETANGSPDLRIVKPKKKHDAQVAWRHTPGFVAEYKQSVIGAGLTLGEYAEETHRYVVEELAKAASEAGVSLPTHVGSVLRERRLRRLSVKDRSSETG